MFAAQRQSTPQKAFKANQHYQRAEEHWRQGQLKRAFRFFLAAARAGITSAFRIVGQFYDQGNGVKVNPKASLYWYRRAYRNGDNSVANNIACILRDRRQFRQALLWFHRAVDSGDGDANLNIANLYLHTKGDVTRATHFLKHTCKARNVTQGSKEEARHLLHQLKNEVKERPVAIARA